MLLYMYMYIGQYRPSMCGVYTHCAACALRQCVSGCYIISHIAIQWGLQLSMPFTEALRRQYNNYLWQIALLGKNIDQFYVPMPRNVEILTSAAALGKASVHNNVHVCTYIYMYMNIYGYVRTCIMSLYIRIGPIYDTYWLITLWHTCKMEAILHTCT